MLEHFGAEDLIECCAFQLFIYGLGVPAENPRPTPQSLLCFFGKAWRDVDTPEFAAQDEFEDVPGATSDVENFVTLNRLKQ